MPESAYPVGSVWDTHAGNHWQVLKHLDDNRIRVKLVYCEITKRRSNGTRVTPASEGEFVWHESSLANAKRIS